MINRAYRVVAPSTIDTTTPARPADSPPPDILTPPAELPEVSAAVLQAPMGSELRQINRTEVEGASHRYWIPGGFTLDGDSNSLVIRAQPHTSEEGRQRLGGARHFVLTGPEGTLHVLLSPSAPKQERAPAPEPPAPIPIAATPATEPNQLDDVAAALETPAP